MAETFRQRLTREHPDCVGPEFIAGCRGCPYLWGYEERPMNINETNSTTYCGVYKYFGKCSKCWDRIDPASVEGE